MVKKILVILLGAADAALLVVILVAAITGWRMNGQDRVPVVEPVAQESEEPSAVSGLSSAQESGEPSAASSPSSAQESEEPSAVSSLSSAQESRVSHDTSSEKTSRPVIPDYDSMTTTAYPSVDDIVRFDIHKGWDEVTANAQPLTEAYQVLGGWKAYFVLDPQQKQGESIQKTANLHIGFGQSDLTVTVNWHEMFHGDLQAGIPDRAPDTVFRGSWSAGGIEAVGSGRITLETFGYWQGREYAAGHMIWPDGTDSVIGLIRP